MPDSQDQNQPVGRIAKLWRYPVKSMLGEACDELELDERGAIGDRFYAVRRNDGKLGSGKDSNRFCAMPGLFEFHVRLEKGLPLLRFPDGHEWRADDPQIHGALSAALGQEVTLVTENDIAHMDAGAVHLVTSAGLRWLADGAGSESCDPRRFRPNILVELNGRAPVENEWLGRNMTVGDGVRLTITQPTGRCIMTTFAQDDLGQDTAPLQFLSRRADGRFGVYATVTEPGTLRVGDPIRISGSAASFH